MDNGTPRANEKPALKVRQARRWFPLPGPSTCRLKCVVKPSANLVLRRIRGKPTGTPEDVAFAQALIDQVGQVLENARLLEETERSAQREKAVAGAAEKIHRATDIETVLQSAISELNRITGRRGISVQLGFGHAEVQRPSEGNGHGTDAEGDR